MDDVMDCKYDPNRICPLREPECDCCSIKWDWEREIQNEED